MKDFYGHGTAMSRTQGLEKPKTGEDTQTYTSFVPYITSVGKQCLLSMAYNQRLIAFIFFVAFLFVLFDARAQSVEIRTAEGQKERGAEVFPAKQTFHVL